ncbi:MAG TPA: hypothetical protein VMT18_04655 [Planctomycetota bacterium]|nr:hypothetical protein [Planctomycetota bacterium]
MHTRISQFSGSRRAGSVLLVAVMIMMLVATMTLAFLQIGVRFTRELSTRIDDERALMLAEAALEESLFAMRAGGSGSVGTAAAPARQGDGVCWATATPVGVSLSLVQAAGMCGSGRAAVQRLVFSYPPGQLESFAIFANNDLELESNVLIDSFDAGAGTYATQLAMAGTGYVSAMAITGSNGNVTVASSVEVWGDLHPGVGMSVSVPGSSSVSGSLQPLPEPIDLPPVSTPTLPFAGNVSVEGVGVMLPSGDYSYGFFKTLSNTSITVTGPARIVTDTLTLASNSTLTLDTSTGPIEIYVKGASSMASNAAIITTKKSAVDCSLYFVGGPGQTATLASNSDFYGRVYSQQGKIVINSNFNVYGSVIADRLVLNANSQVHYDEALRNTLDNDDLRFVPFGWSMAGFPLAVFTSDRRDPFMLLGVDPTDLASPAASHAP